MAKRIITISGDTNSTYVPRPAPETHEKGLQGAPNASQAVTSPLSNGSGSNASSGGGDAKQ